MLNMSKNKLKVQKMKNLDVDGDDSNNDNYDSMIENGTSGSSDESDDEVNSKNKNDSGEGSEKNDEDVDHFNGKGKYVKKTATKYVKRRFVDEDKEPEVKKLKKDDKYKPPTVKEINQLRETENLFHSNLFRLQIEEIMTEIKVSPKYLKLSENWLENFKNIIFSMESDKPDKKISDVKNKLKLNNIKFPLNINESSLNDKFQFLKPNSCKFVGSYQTSTLIGPILNIDICIEMPSKMFSKAGQLNLNSNYHYHRAIYLCLIAIQLKESNTLVDDLKFTYYKNDTLRPILIVTPNGKLQKKITFNIHIVCAEHSFKLTRFTPDMNNVTLIRDNKHSQTLTPTPHYNSTILFDLTFIKNHDYLQNMIQPCPNIQDGIKLIKIWLKQRGLDNGLGGFNSFIVSMYICYLLKERKLFTTMSSYQIVRTFWNNLSISEWNEQSNVITLCNIVKENLPKLEEFRKCYDIVFIDVTGFYNICSTLSLELYKRVKLESIKAVEFLDNKNINSFRCLFMINMPFYNQYDHIISINSTDTINSVIKTVAKDEDLMNYHNCWYSHILNIVTKLLRKGLDNRIITITPIIQTIKPWNIKKTQKNNEYSLVLGLVLNPFEAYHIINKGPSADLPESNEFRKFWGDKSQLRRYKDGSITESIVWKPVDSSLQEKRLICYEIVKYIFEFHLKLSKFNYIASQLNETNELKNINEENTIKTVECNSLNIIRKFDDLCKFIRSCNDLPLSITSIQGISSVFRYCDNLPTPAKGFIYKTLFYNTRIHNGIIQLETSGKWPENLDAIQRLKAAFYIQIFEYLRKSDYKVLCSVDGFDVLKDGYIFHFSMIHQKELTLTKQEYMFNNVKYLRESDESLELEKNNVILPIINSYLHGIYQKYPAFGPSVCMAKSWLYNNLIDQYLWPDECTELLMANLFLKVEPYIQPCQPQVAFFRFIKMLSDTDWLNEMIFINFNDEIEYDEIIKIEQKFIEQRDQFPSLCILTSADIDKCGLWSKKNPTEHILAYVTLLSRNSLEKIENILSFDEKNNLYQMLFKKKITLNNFNVCLFLHTELRRYGNIKNSENLFPAGLDVIQCYLNELRKAYDDFALFFYNPIVRNKIYVLWRPNINEEKPFKTNLTKGQKLVNNKLVPNKKAIINDFCIIGKGLVSKAIEANFINL